MALTLIKFVGMEYATLNSKHKRKMGLYECSGCGKRDKRPVAVVNAGYTNWCVDCGIKIRRTK